MEERRRGGNFADVEGKEGLQEQNYKVIEREQDVVHKVHMQKQVNFIRFSTRRTEHQVQIKRLTDLVAGILLELLG